MNTRLQREHWPPHAAGEGAAARGGVTVISQPALATYTSPYFFTNSSTNEMTFWCPENGAHTSGSSFPRSELRQIPNWYFKGHSQLNVTMRVSKVPSTGSITIGQVHADGLQGHCSIVIELEYTNGDIDAHLRDSACKGVTKKVGSGYALGESFSYSLTIDGTLATASSDSGTMAPYDYSWPTIGGIPTEQVPIYFKLGDYVQAATNSATEGGVVAVESFSYHAAT
jgi:hypothetical protein